MGGPPPKSGLGRNLGTLLRNAQNVPGPSRPAGEPQAARPAVSPGMATLLRGSSDGGKPEQQPAPAQHTALLRGTLVVADLLLCGLVAWLAFSSARPWGAGEVLLSISAILTGAWLAYLALTLNSVSGAPVARRERNGHSHKPVPSRNFVLPGGLKNPSQKSK